MATEFLITFLTSLGLSREAVLSTWQPLILYVVGMTVYAVFVFELYHFISRKNIFELDLVDYAKGRERFKNAMKVVLYFVKYLVIFPILPIVWFVVFTFLLAILSTGRTIESLLLVSMAVVSTIRIGAYYDERLAEDVAKMLPLALLGIFLIDGVQALSVQNIFEVVTSVALEWRTIMYYWLFTVLLELVLRITTIIWHGQLETELGENERVEKEKAKDKE